jgi:hypothetical protein
VLAPEIVPQFQAKSPRPMNQQDLATASTCPDIRHLEWLAAAMDL